MEEKKVYIKAELEDGTTTTDIAGSPRDLGYLVASSVLSIAKSSEIPVPVLMGYIKFAINKLSSSEKDEDKDCENCPEREKCQEMNDAMKLIRGRL